MNICVIATASRNGGALAIYNQFLCHLAKNISSERYIIFVDRYMPRKKIAGVKFISVDTSGFKRMAFDLWGLKKLLGDNCFEADRIVSLQNTAVRYMKSVPQLIYYHQSLPFFKYKFSLFNSEGRTYFFYHYLYPHYVKFLSYRKVSYVVQTDYVRKCFLKRFKNVYAGRVYSFFPDVERINDNTIPNYIFEDGTINFFYPASGNAYKEHRTLVYAMSELRKEQPDVVKKIRVYFSLLQNQCLGLCKLIAENGLQEQFVFCGIIEHKDLLSMMYSSHGLLFPSVIETIGLPLLEAAALGVPVVANDLPFVHSVIDEYEGVSFVELHNYQQWSKVILSLSKERKRFPTLKQKESSWPEVFKLIKTLGSSKE